MSLAPRDLKSRSVYRCCFVVSVILLDYLEQSLHNGMVSPSHIHNSNKPVTMAAPWWVRTFTGHCGSPVRAWGSLRTGTPFNALCFIWCEDFFKVRHVGQCQLFHCFVRHDVLWNLDSSTQSEICFWQANALSRYSVAVGSYFNASVESSKLLGGNWMYSSHNAKHSKVKCLLNGHGR